MSNLAAKFQQAYLLHQRGEVLRAKTLYEEVLRKDPKHPGALSLLGLLAGQTGDLRHAAQLYAKVVELDPDNAAAHNNRGMALQGLKQWEAAAASYHKAVKIKPEYTVAHCNLGNVLMELKQYDAALVSYERAVALDTHNAAVHCNLGFVLEALGRLDEALIRFDRALALKPDFAEAHYNRGNVLKGVKRWNEALVSYDRAVELNPTFVLTHHNRGLVLHELRQWEAALASYDQAISRSGDSADAYSDRGSALRELGKYEMSRASFDRAIALSPAHAAAHTNRGILRLLLGDFTGGWEDYEWRWRLADTSSLATHREFVEPRWSGSESLAGKTILLHNEQGFGDTLQFCRYAKVVAALGARVILEVPTALSGLMKTLSGVSHLIVRGDVLPPFDYHCPLMSLPRSFNTRLENIPVYPSYISVDPVKVKRLQGILGGKVKPRVGLVWRGSADYKSIPLADLVQILPAKFEFVSLQKEVPEADKATLERNPSIRDYSGELHDFSETAALCACLDLVISVDTSVAHLSGALGKPTWIAVMASPDWRWLLDRDDSPWYPSAKLYRQARIDDWGAALAHIGRDLRDAL